MTEGELLFLVTTLLGVVTIIGIVCGATARHEDKERREKPRL